MPWRVPGRLPRACGRGRERVRTTEDHRETGRDLLWGDRGWLGMRGYGYYFVLLEIWDPSRALSSSGAALCCRLCEWCDGAPLGGWA